MFILRKKYFLIVESIKDIDLRNIKKRNKFIIIYRNTKKADKRNDLIKFRNECKSKHIRFYVANDLKLAVNLKSDGIYISANNKNFKALNLKKINYDIIGSAHNLNEINLKKKQGCHNVLLSRLFKVSYKPNMNFLDVIKFNNYITKIFINITPLGGINLLNLNKLKIVRSESFALMTEVKKKPAKIFSRLF